MTVATACSSTRFFPDTSSRSGLPELRPRNTSDLTICPTSQPQARAASSAVRVLSGIWRISTAIPSPSAAAFTRATARGSSSPIGNSRGIACTFRPSWTKIDIGRDDKARRTGCTSDVLSSPAARRRPQGVRRRPAHRAPGRSRPPRRHRRHPRCPGAAPRHPAGRIAAPRCRRAAAGALRPARFDDRRPARGCGSTS